MRRSPGRPGQFVNLFLFFVGISLVIAAVVLTRFTAPLKSRWDSHTKVPLKVSTAGGPARLTSRPPLGSRFPLERVGALVAAVCAGVA